MSDLGLAVVQRIAKYPPQRPGTRYRRTGTLGRGWTKQGPAMEGSDLVVKVGNNVEYTPSVQGFTSEEPRQAGLFAAYGWESVETAGKEELDRHRPSIEKALEGK